MRKISLLILVTTILFASGSVVSAEKIETAMLYRVEQGGKYGFIDSKGNLVIKPQFDYVEDFAEGRARFEFGDDKYGYIDQQGNIVVEPIYDYAMDFHDGVAVVITFEDNKILTKIIDYNGETVLDLQEGFTLGYSEGLAMYFPKNPLTNFDEELKIYGFLNKQGEQVIEPKYEFSARRGGSEFQEGLAPVRLNEKTGYINSVGEVVIGFQYEEALPFHHGLAAVQNEEGQWGFINKTGRYVIKPQFEDATSFNEGLAAVISSRNNKWGFINKAGKFVIPAKYEDVDEFHEGLAPVNFGDSDNERWGYIDRKGKTIVSPQFDDAEPFRGGLARVTIGQLDVYKADDRPVGYINKQGKYVWKPSK